jgi:hypothetical protein
MSTVPRLTLLRCSLVTEAGGEVDAVVVIG